MRGTTIARVAEEAGVGVGTVSRVLNGSPAVSDGTRRRVLQAIATLDYQPSPAARALSTGRTNAIGVVAPFFTQPSVIERLRGVSHTLASEGYQLILHDVERPDLRRELFRALAARGRIDGLLAISLAPTEREARRLERAGVPVVLLDRAHDELPCITIDDMEGGRMAAEHLLGLGHTRIAFLGDEEANLFGFDSSAHRREGFEAAMEAAAITPPPEWVLRRPHGRGGHARAIRAAHGRLRELRRPGDRGARGGARSWPAGARAAVGHRLRQRGGRGVHRADHDRAAAGGDRAPRRRSAAARGVRRGGGVAPDATRDRRAGLHGPAEPEKVSGEG
jgi:DNA-binding LacI/PurR family transcriptional regulator